MTAEQTDRGIEPIELDATKAGPGHYVISGAALAVDGEWAIEITSRASDFNEFRSKLQVLIR